MAVKETKDYVVKKDGQVLKSYKSLPAAKQLAEKEMANVYCDGICVYKVVPEEGEADTTSLAADIRQKEEAEAKAEAITQTETADSIDLVEQEKESAASKEGKAKYTLTTLMNVRKEPSLGAGIVKTLKAGTTVDVDALVDDWLHLSDGTYIFYNGGKYAEKEA